MTYKWKLGDSVVYRGKTYNFVGEVCGLTDDGQVIVRATVGPYRGMKHIYGAAQLAPFHLSRLIEVAARAVCQDSYPCDGCLANTALVLDAIKELPLCLATS